MALAQGRGTKPADYLRYIEYERRLEKLRKARAARLRESPSSWARSRRWAVLTPVPPPAETESTKSLSDHSIPAHITQLHRLSVRRFPESLTLWDAFIAHALSQSSPNLVSRTLSSAIAMHPTHTPYWIMASQWESEGDRKGMGGGNAEAARRLCMRALRFLKGNRGEAGRNEGPEEAVWREWIRVEVSFVEKLRARWQVLGLGKGKGGKEEIIRVKGANGEADGGDEEEEIQLPVTEGDDAGDARLEEELTEQAKSGQEALLDGAIVRLVIDNLLKCA